MNKIEAIVFDLDNTLYDFSDAWLQAHKKLFYHLKLDEKINYDDFLNIFRKYDKEILEEIKEGNIRIRQLRNLRIQKTMEYFGIFSSEEDAKNYYKEMFNFIKNEITRDKELVQILAKLKNKYKLFLLTNGISKEQHEKLKILGLENIFIKKYISQETMINKPNLKAFLQIACENKLDLENMLMIGDSLFHDIAPAQKLGMQTVLVEKEWHLTNLESDYDYTGEKTDNLKKVLEKLLVD